MAKKIPSKAAVITEIPEGLPVPVLVCWEDAKVVSDGGAWMETRDLEYTPCLFWQVGFLVKDVPEGIMLVDAWNTELMGNPTQIPRGMVRSVTPLT